MERGPERGGGRAIDRHSHPRQHREGDRITVALSFCASRSAASRTTPAFHHCAVCSMLIPHLSSVGVGTGRTGAAWSLSWSGESGWLRSICSSFAPRGRLLGG